MSLAGPCNVVLGAGGKSGQECVKRLLQVTDLPVRAVVRDPSRYSNILPKSEKLELVKGDVTDLASLRTCLQGAKGVIFTAAGTGYWTPAQVDYQGVVNVAEVAKEVGVERVVLVSSMLVTYKHRFHPIRILLNNIRWSLMDNKFKGEEALRGSGVPYTVVRPGGLNDNPAGQSTIVTAQGDVTGGSVGSICRADMAAVCVEALANPKASNITVEIISKPGLSVPLADHLKSMWDGLKQGVA